MNFVIPLSKFRKEFSLAFLIISLALLLFFFPVLSGENIVVANGFFNSDSLLYHLPLRVHYAKALKSGILPLWIGEIGNGFPAHAEGLVGMAYPLNLVLYRLLPPILAYNLSFYIHFLFAGLFMFLYLRKVVNVGFFSSVFSALSLPLSAFFVLAILDIDLVTVLSFFPLVLFAAEKLLSLREVLKYGLLLSAAFFMQATGGNLQALSFEVFILALYLLLRVYFSSPAGERLRKGLKIFFFVFVFGVFALFLSAVQLLPSLELIPYSIRGGGLNFSEAIRFIFPKRAVLSLFAPWLFDFKKDVDFNLAKDEVAHVWEYYTYIGLTPLFFIILAILKRGKRRLNFFRISLVMAFFSLLLAAGKATPLYEIVWTFIPGMSFFRQPTRILFYFQFFLILLAALGFNVLESRLATAHRFRRCWLIFIIFTVAFNFADLFYFNRRPLVIGKAREWLSPPRYLNFLGNTSDYRIASLKEGFFGYSALQNDYLLEFLKELSPADFIILFGGRTSDSYAQPLLLSTRRAFNEHFSKSLMYETLPFGAGGRGEGKLTLSKEGERTLKVQGIKYLLSPVNIESASFKLVGKIPFTPKDTGREKRAVIEITSEGGDKIIEDFKNVFIFKLADAEPLAKGVGSVRLLGGKTLGEKIGFLSSDDFILKGIYLEEEVNFKLCEKCPFEIVERSDAPGKYFFKTVSEGPKMFYLAESYYPGWAAFVDGEETKILKTNAGFQSVYLPEGKHRLVFRFFPYSFKLGFLISAVSWVILFLVLAIRQWWG